MGGCPGVATDSLPERSASAISAEPVSVVTECVAPSRQMSLALPLLRGMMAAAAVSAA